MIERRTNLPSSLRDRKELTMNVLDDYRVDVRLSLLDKTRIQAQVLLPVLQALRAELGKQRADAIVRQALRGWSKQLFAAVGGSVEGSLRRKWATMHTAFAEITEREVRVEMQRHDKEALEFDVTRCRFAEFFRALGEPDLGALLICETDFDIVAAGGGEVSLTRDQTLMQGAPSCTFRYKFQPRS
jgi:L-2-amino-thiazoline-4-carboxylic acid hydrolase